MPDRPTDAPPYGPPGSFGPPTAPQAFSPPAPAYPPAAYPPSGYPSHDDQAYEPAYPPAPYGDPGFGPAPYDAATEVFDRGLLTTDPYGDAHTGVIPVTPPAGLGSPAGFGAPPPSAGFGPPPPSAGFGAPPPSAGFGPPPASAGFGAPPASAGFGPPPSDEPEPTEHDETPLFSRFRRIRSHAKQRPSRRWVAVLIVIVLIGGTAGARFWPGSPWYYLPADEGAPAVAMPFSKAEISADTLGTAGFLSWAYEDMRDLTLVGSPNMAETTSAGPLLTAWFGADVLRRAAEEGQTPAGTVLADIEAMIRDEDPTAADRVVVELDGTEDSIDRLRTMCHLDDLTPAEGPWQETAISAQDAARMGGCLADGRAAGAEWTPWLLNVMRQVRGEGGIRQAFPPGERAMIAVTNGIMLSEADGEWRANCLAVSETWSLAILQRFPASGDQSIDRAHINTICQQVTQELTASQ